MKKYFIFQEGNEILAVVNTSGDEFDEETLRAFHEEVVARGFNDAIDIDVAKALRAAERGEVIRIGGYSLPMEKDSGDGDATGTTEIWDRSLKPFEIEIHKDDLAATLFVKAGFSKITQGRIHEYLREIGIVYGIIEENIATICQRYPLLRQILIAQGTPPTTGEDARIELVKPIKTDLSPVTLESGRVDFKKLNLISPVKVGDVIQIRTPPTRGEPGKDVFGKEIPGRIGRNRLLIKGINTSISKDGLYLSAVEEGLLYFSPGGVVNVRAVYTVNGDVDYHTGIIDYGGDVIVKGDVRAGFDVFAGGDVQILGSVEDVTIEAKGEIQIYGGVRSSGVTTIKAGGDVKVNFLERARVQTPGNVYINREAIDCDIRAGGDVEVLWDRGCIKGGHITAGGWIAAPTLGSAMGGHVELALEPHGWEPYFKAVDKINKEMTNVCDSGKIDDKDCSAVLKKLVEQRVSEAGRLDAIFAYSFVTAKSYLSPVNVRFGNVVKKLETDTGPATFTFKSLAIQSDYQFMDKSQREKLQRERLVKKTATKTLSRY